MRFMIPLFFLALPDLATAGDLSSPLDRLDPKKNLPSPLPPGTPRAAVAMMQEQFRAIAALTFSRQDKLLAASSWDNSVVLWKIDQDKVVHWDTLQASPSSIAFSPDGKTLAAGTADSRVALWNLTGAKPKLQGRLAGHKQRPFQASFSPTGKMFASASFDPVVRLWKMAGEEPEPWAVLANEDAPAVGISSLAFSGDGKLLAAGNFLGGKKSLRLWKTDGPFLDEMELPAAVARLVVFAAKKPLLAFSGDDGKIHLWDCQGGKPAPHRTIAAHPAKENGGVKSLVLSPDGRWLVSGGVDRKVILWNTTEGKVIRDWLMPEEPRTLAFAADGRHFAIGADDGTIYVMRLE